MELLKRQRASIKGQITRIDTYCQSTDSNLSLPNLQARQSKLEQYMRDFERIQNEIEAGVPDEQFQEEVDYRACYEDHYYSVQAKLIAAINSLSLPTAASPNPFENSQSVSSTLNALNESQTALNTLVQSLVNSSRKPININKFESPRLPEIKLPEFSGKYDEWIRFRDLFSALVVNKSTIADIEKMEYLQTRLRGEAASLIKHMPPSNENFAEAWKILKEHYDKNESKIIVAHLDNIFDQQPLRNSSLSDMKQLFNTTNENINALRALKLPIESWDILLVYHLTKKFDAESKVLWTRQNKNNNQPSYADLISFLQERISELEALELAHTVRACQSPKLVTKDVKCKRVLNSVSPNCFKCREKHFLYQCNQFRCLSIPSRIEFVKLNRICINCLRVKHLPSECKFSSCRICGCKHNTLVHLEHGYSDVQPSTSKDSSKNLLVNSVQHSPFDVVTLLPTITLFVRDSNDQLQQCRALLDSGSQSTIITEACVQRLNLRRSNARLPIAGIGEQLHFQSTRGQVNLIMCPSSAQDLSLCTKAYILSSITSDLPNMEISKNRLSFFDNLDLADQSYCSPSKIDILIGADIFFDVLRDGKIIHPSGSPVAQNTIFGWVIAGNVQVSQHRELKILHTSLDLDVLFKRFCEHEEFQDVKQIPEEDNNIEKYFVFTHYVRSDGRYVVSLPFASQQVQFGESRNSAVKRLHAMEKRFRTNPDLKREYLDFMHVYEELGHMSIVPRNELNNSSFYLPHHAVIKPFSTTTRLRVVFDGSCKSSNGVALNDVLLVGPTIQHDLITCLIRFRKYKVAVKADIGKMYRCVFVNQSDLDYQRIVWRNNPNEELRDYRLNTVTYGTASASFLATRVLKQIGIDNSTKYPRASDSIINDFYVDDYMSGFHNYEEAITVKNEVCYILKNAGMDLRKWSSNSSAFLDTLQPENREDATELPIGEFGVKTLGLLWDTKNDCFKFSSSIPSLNPYITKRQVLSDIARIFDPLGWVAPAVVKMKIFMKRLWLKGIGWDTHIPSELFDEWSDFRSEINCFSALSMPRWLQFEKDDLLELHGFSDASESAYAAVVYSRVVKNNKIRTSLICAKTRVAPAKPTLTIPRLELSGSLLLIKLLSKVKDALSMHNIRCFAYTDSTVVLHWIQGYPRQRNVFVDNRLSQIISSFPASIWHHVRSMENPADCATRGIMPRNLLNLNLWWNGPIFLRDAQIKFSPLPNNIEEPIKNGLVCLTRYPIDECDIFEKFSNLNRLFRVIARCLRLFRSRNLPKSNTKLRPLSVSDIQSAKRRIFAISQSTTFSEEISCLQNNKPVSNKSKLFSMSPFIDDEGLLRVGGRLDNANIPFEQKHPLILHKDHRLSKLIVRDCHLKNLHAGIRQMTYLLSLTYFIIGVHHIIKSCIYQCPTCMRQKAIPFKQQMAHLPKQRLQPGMAFQNTGVDFAGPVTVRSWKGRGAKQYKAYIALYICLSTKALHLELVTELSSAAFIASLRRFVSRRGKCHTLFSDNGTNFVGANQQLREWSSLLYSSGFQEEVSNMLTTEGINWRFLPPHAPHFGGIWEAGVKTVKYHLRRVLGNTSVTYEDFSTVLCQIEACANSRPLCVRFEGDTDPITPAHFLIMRPISTVPDSNVLEVKVTTLNRWQYLQRLVQDFWRRWSQDYLSQLRKRSKWAVKCQNIRIDDVVIIKDENRPPCQWIIGRVIQTHPGQDGLVRVVTIATPNGQLRRPVCKLCPLFVDEC